MQFQKISILPPVPPGNSSLASYFASKILIFKTPLPLGISDDLPWGGYGLHNAMQAYLGVLRVPIGIYNAIILLEYLIDFYEFLTPVSLKMVL